MWFVWIAFCFLVKFQLDFLIKFQFYPHVCEFLWSLQWDPFSTAIILTKEGSRLLLNDRLREEGKGKKRWWAGVGGGSLAREHLCLVLLTEEGLPVCSPASMAVCLYEWLRDWFILVHHPSHQSFTGDWVSKDDKNQPLIRSKVSGSDRVWVHAKRLALPCRLRSLPSSSPSSSPSVTHSRSLSFPLHTLSAHPFPEIYEGNVWIWMALWTRCQTTSEKLCWGSTLHTDVVLVLPLLSPPFALLLLPSRGVWKWPLVDWSSIWPYNQLRKVDCSSKCPIKIIFQSCAERLPYGWSKLWAPDWPSNFWVCQRRLKFFDFFHSV